MTANKYRKYNESIRLSEEAKEDILNQILAADIKPARRTVPGWRWAAVFACGLALFAFLMMPRAKVQNAEPAIAAEESTARDEPAAEAGMMDAAAPSEAVLSAETLSSALGYRIPDMNGYAPDMTADYEQVSETQACITLSNDSKQIQIFSSPAAEAEVQAAGAYEENAETASEAVSDQAEEMILSMMMNSPEAAIKFEEELGYLNKPEHQTLAMMILDARHTNGICTPSGLIDISSDESIRNLITSIATGSDFAKPYDEKVMNGAIRKVKITVLNSEADAYKQQLNADLNSVSRQLILNKYANCLRELRRYIDEENSQ